MKEDVASFQDEASAKAMDDTIVYGVIIDLTNTSVMEETPKAFNAAMADEVEHNALEPASKQSTTSNEATSRDKGGPNVAIVYSTSLGPHSFELSHISMLGAIVAPTLVPKPPFAPTSLDPPPPTLSPVPPPPQSSSPPSSSSPPPSQPLPPLPTQD
ncbi:hypothetical protein JHK84_043217 [Glycine max]|nr:hypothetical protein JHK84_043217 [Glycine max]